MSQVKSDLGFIEALNVLLQKLDLLLKTLNIILQQLILEVSVWDVHVTLRGSCEDIHCSMERFQDGLGLCDLLPRPGLLFQVMINLLNRNLMNKFNLISLQNILPAWVRLVLICLLSVLSLTGALGVWPNDLWTNTEDVGVVSLE